MRSSTRSMNHPHAESRRRFIHQCAICAGAAALPGSWARLLAAVPATHHGGVETPATQALAFKYFTPEQAATVEAVAEQIIPADDDPGARWAGVVHYIDLGLAGEFAALRPTYEAGLKRLQALTREFGEMPFERLDFATQTKVLEKLEGDDGAAGGSNAGREFFALIRRHTLEGFFGDPKYGGNRDYAGWKMLKFEG